MKAASRLLSRTPRARIAKHATATNSAPGYLEREEDHGKDEFRSSVAKVLTKVIALSCVFVLRINLKNLIKV